MKVAGIPPTSTSMFNNICYELVAELADGIPDIASNIRKKLDLPDKVLEFKEGATRDLVYTTGPDLSIWRYDPHLLQIGGPPVEYAEQVIVNFVLSLSHYLVIVFFWIDIWCRWKGRGRDTFGSKSLSRSRSGASQERQRRGRTGRRERRERELCKGGGRGRREGPKTTRVSSSNTSSGTKP
jgi:hypothetical protein